jgi:hypothetical protein
MAWHISRLYAPQISRVTARTWPLDPTTHLLQAPILCGQGTNPAFTKHAIRSMIKTFIIMNKKIKERKKNDGDIYMFLDSGECTYMRESIMYLRGGVALANQCGSHCF